MPAGIRGAPRRARTRRRHEEKQHARSDAKGLFEDRRVSGGIRRGEVYEYIWALLTLGTVDLEKERTKLVVRAVEIPGERAFNLKAVKLRQIK